MTQTRDSRASAHGIQWAITEASRCFFCVEAPCIRACPVHIDIPQFVRLIRWRDFKGAKETIKTTNWLGAVCGYLCPAEKLCEKDCLLSKLGSPIPIAALQRFACENSDYESISVVSVRTNKKVAVVGAGPAGLSCALELKRLGHEVDLFEKEKFIAGTVAKEIPDFKLPREVLIKEIGELSLDPAKVHLGVEVGPALLQNEIGKQYDAVFLGVGLSRPWQARLKKGNLKNVLEASDFLAFVKRGVIRRMKGVIITVGGGDTAMDCARMALRLGAKRSVVAYRRSKREMPAAEGEFRKAVEEGVEFLWQVSPVRLRGEKRVAEIEFVRTELMPGGHTGRRRFKEIAGAKLKFPADTVVFALGKDRDSELVPFLDERGAAFDPETLRIGKTKYFAGGDFLNRGRTVVQAVADGRKAAKSIDLYLRST